MGVEEAPVRNDPLSVSLLASPCFSLRIDVCDGYYCYINEIWNHHMSKSLGVSLRKSLIKLKYEDGTHLYCIAPFCELVSSTTYVNTYFLKK